MGKQAAQAACFLVMEADGRTGYALLCRIHLQQKSNGICHKYCIFAINSLFCGKNTVRNSIAWRRDKRVK